MFKKRYPQVVANIKDHQDEKNMLKADLKNVVPMKLSNYVYNSTDNLIISKVLGLVTVARYSNYMTIINGIMGMEYILGNVVTSTIGKIIKEKDDPQEVYQYYLMYQYGQFLFTNFCTAALSIVMIPFIKIWLGDSFVLELSIMILLIGDFYIHSMYQPAYVMFGAAGKFKDDKFITIISAVMNLGISLIAVCFIGLAGVIIGTIATDIYIWCVRTYQVVSKYFYKSLKKYILLMLKYIVITVISVALCLGASKVFLIENLYVEFIVRLLISAILPNAAAVLLTCKDEQFRSVKNILFGKLKKKAD